MEEIKDIERQRRVNDFSGPRSCGLRAVFVVAMEPGVICCVGCDASCPLDEFIELTKEVIPTDWHAECNTSVIPNS